jgi:hypothetical protein
MKQFSIAFLIVSFFLATGAARAQVTVRRAANAGHANRAATRTEAKMRLPSPSLAGTVHIKVVWNKIFGLPPAYLGASEAYPSPCGLFIISIYNMGGKVVSSERGTFTTERTEGFERYVCSYTVEALPKNERLAVTATFPASRDLETVPWISVLDDVGAMPGIGQERVLNGARVITLTDELAMANIAFRVQYETPRVSEN